MVSGVSNDSVLPDPPKATLHELVEVGPDLTFGTAASFRGRISDLIILHEVRVIVDLRWTELVDAVGLGALVAARRRLNASGGCLHLVPGPAVQERLASGGLLRFFDLASDPEAATEHRSDRIPGPRWHE
ncbi:MAG TPA: STAS domain-containing protein [Frankiaceae bacterium]|nr:STAS domain-containing protein [Frankiaceae bacterium]